MRVAAMVWRDDAWYVARCVGVDVASQGGTPDEAVENLKEALAVARAAPAEAPPEPSLVLLDVPESTAADRARPAVETATLVRRLEEQGWRIEQRTGHYLLCRGGKRVVVPAFFRIAAGVYEAITHAVGTDVLADAAPAAAAPLARLDALFAAHPHRDDTTRLVREQRDAG